MESESIKALLHDTTRDVRRRVSYQLFKIVQSKDFKDEKGRFYIEKRTKKRSFTVPETNYREIVFLKDKETRKALLAVSKALENLLNNNFQHGFRTHYDIKTFCASTRTDGGMLKIDLKSAFNQLPKRKIQMFFEKACDLRKEEAEILTDLATYRGYMYQGCPYSPMIFNCMIYGALRDINKIKDIQVQSYADDILITSVRGPISFKLAKTIHRIINQYGFKTNPKKSRFCSYTNQTYYLGLKLEEKQIRKGQQTRKKIKHLAYKIIKENIPMDNNNPTWAKLNGYKNWNFLTNSQILSKIMVN